MAIEFRAVEFAPLTKLTVSAPDGAVIGIVGEHGAGKSALLRLAAGIERPQAGQIIASGSRRYLGPGDPLDFSPAGLLAINNTLARADAFERAQAQIALDALRVAGATVLLVSHETELIRRFCDEVWWLEAGRLAKQGDPGEVLDAYLDHIARKLRAWGGTAPGVLRTGVRRGDGRAEIVSLETLGESGDPTMVWRSGEAVKVRAVVAYREAVNNPVIGIMIRTRIGLEVYGTNTELEKIETGRLAAGDRLQIEFQFRCDLCPGEYTLTAASHDSDGTAHDWIDDAAAFVVGDSRYTAGVANLRAQASAAKI